MPREDVGNLLRCPLPLRPDLDRRLILTLVVDHLLDELPGLVELEPRARRLGSLALPALLLVPLGALLPCELQVFDVVAPVVGIQARLILEALAGTDADLAVLGIRRFCLVFGSTLALVGVIALVGTVDVALRRRQRHQGSVSAG